MFNKWDLEYMKMQLKDKTALYEFSKKTSRTCLILGIVSLFVIIITSTLGEFTPSSAFSIALISCATYKMTLSYIEDVRPMKYELRRLAVMIDIIEKDINDGN